MFACSASGAAARGYGQTSHWQVRLVRSQRRGKCMPPTMNALMPGSCHSAPGGKPHEHEAKAFTWCASKWGQILGIVWPKISRPGFRTRQRQESRHQKAHSRH